MKLFRLFLVVALVMLCASPLMASVGYKKAMFGAGAITDINMAGGNASFDGSTLTLYEPFNGGVSTAVSQVSQISQAYLAFGVVELSGSTKTFSVAAGLYSGQSVTLERAEGSPLALVLNEGIDNPVVAHTGWNTVTFSTTVASSSVTLTWIDSTVGWVITGYYNVTIT